MNLILLAPDESGDGRRFRLTGVRARHVVEVLRAEPGQELRVGLLEGPKGRGRVVVLAPDVVELDCEFEREPPPRPLVDLILAIPRAKSLRKLLPEVTALGVDRIVLLRSWRVAKPYLSQSILAPEEHRPLLHEGLMQARCTREPRVVVEPLFKPFVEDRLPAFVVGARAFVAHPGAERTFASARIAASERVVLAIGPEGGWIPYEVAAFERAGFTPVSLGERPLRVETACVALLAQLALVRALAAT
jgi:RsmE family RNA methyltransferase